MLRSGRAPILKWIVCPAGQRRAMSTSSQLGPLVTTSQVDSLISSGLDVRFVDASWYLDKARNGLAEFKQERLPGAVFFDIDSIKDTSSSLPHMLPPPAAFASSVQSLGISNDSTVVVYGGFNCFSPARCWWTFKYFGHDQVHVLNGGLTQWKKEGRQVERGEPGTPVPASYVASPRPALVLNAQQMLKLLNTKDQIIDARGPNRFFAKEPEPRPGMRGGHMPGALNVPFGKVVAADDFSAWRDVDEIRANFEASGVRLADTTLVATTCGSGVTASVLSLGMHLLGVPLERVPVYDGSWSEWGASADLPVVQD
ncbi:hypothetical protein H310_05464 [Aphanomyces invadans]|uniref:Sulfurtransferase n=1 Tax=Aphanomyces invadans TaxID=157072 RepID=A0A024UBN4_9STRA|nr:hypothetical protein H310_05464 [Aphanomyces invadans]ETW03033.1 hypothetical protein H310_05464 [Aphanomyces invadans]|eukprot:XP_008868417.1 hypothetical protein H310_05464 [Aphanomyces invadans]